LDLVPGPVFIAGDVLPALRAGKLDFSHKRFPPGGTPTPEELSR
jgi:hypothetical protein